MTPKILCVTLTETGARGLKPRVLAVGWHLLVFRLFNVNAEIHGSLLQPFWQSVETIRPLGSLYCTEWAGGRTSFCGFWVPIFGVKLGSQG